MFEITSTPFWVVFMSAMFLVILVFSVPFFFINWKDLSTKGRTVSVFVASASLIFLICASLGTFSKHEIVDNPRDVQIFNANGDKTKLLSIKKSTLKEKIQKEISSNFVDFEVESDGYTHEKAIFENLNKGKLVKFVAFKEDEAISVDGSVYFTEDSMVIFVENEDTPKDKIIIPVQ